MAYIRIVYIDELNKLGIQNFSIWDNLWFRKLVCRRRNLKITNLNRLNFLKWKVDQNNNCISWWSEQTWYSKLFNLSQNFSIWDNLGFRKLVCKHRNLKIINLNRPNYSNGKLTKTRIVDLDEFNKLGIQNFSI